MSKQRKSKKIDSVNVSTPQLVFVEIADRRAFDEIAATCVDQGKHGSSHALVKTIEGPTVRVIFQYWIEREGTALSSVHWEDWKNEKRADARDAATERAA